MLYSIKQKHALPRKSLFVTFYQVRRQLGKFVHHVLAFFARKTWEHFWYPIELWDYAVSMYLPDTVCDWCVGVERRTRPKNVTEVYEKASSAKYMFKRRVNKLTRSIDDVWCRWCYLKNCFRRTARRHLNTERWRAGVGGRTGNARTCTAVTTGNRHHANEYTIANYTCSVVESCCFSLFHENRVLSLGAVVTGTRFKCQYRWW